MLPYHATAWPPATDRLAIVELIGHDDKVDEVECALDTRTYERASK